MDIASGAGHDAHASEQQPFVRDQSDNRSGRRTERDTDPDFAATADDRIGQNPVDADRRQQQRQQTEASSVRAAAYGTILPTDV